MEDKSSFSCYYRYIASMHEAIESDADVRGCFVWTLLDKFEWTFGYSKRVGLFRVNFETLERTPKPAEWYKANGIEFIGKEGMGLPKKATYCIQLGRLCLGVNLQVPIVLLKYLSLLHTFSPTLTLLLPSLTGWTLVAPMFGEKSMPFAWLRPFSFSASCYGTEK